MVKVRINCPECNKRGYIEVRENIINDCQRGVTDINISAHLVCKHSFIAYIDKCFIMRDAFITDFTVELPEIDMNKQSSKT